MPWARIPPDKLVNLPLFGIDTIGEDGNFLWVRGPHGRMAIDKRAPRVFFDSIEDAHQAGATAIKIGGEEDRAELERLNAEAMALAEAQAAAGDEEDKTAG